MVNRNLLEDAHALVIGISSYVHVPPLPPAVRDGAAQVAGVLADSHLGGYSPDHVHLLVDEQATRTTILEELAILAGQTSPDSTVLLYFAGHGGRSQDALGETFLLAAASDDSDSASLAATAIAGSELAAALARIPAARVMVIFDCCHSGGLGGTASPRGLAAGLPESYCQSLSAGMGRVVLASARSDECSWLPEGEGLTLFTRHLLAALRGAAGKAGWIHAWDLFQYIQPRVTAERCDQHPVLKAELEENFPVAFQLGGRNVQREEEAAHRFHAYVSYADREPDATWVWQALLPRLEAAGLTIAVSGDADAPGLAQVVAAEIGIRDAQRTILVLSDAYLEDQMTGFVDTLAQTVGLEEGTARLLPIRFSDSDLSRLPTRLRMLVTLDLHHPQRGPRNFNRLVQALHTPPPRSWTVNSPAT